MADRKLVVQIVGDSKQLERTFARSSRAAGGFGKNIERAGRGGLVATVGFRGLGRSVAFASGAFLGGAGFVAGARAALKAASDLSEEVNKSKVLFGSSAAEVERWSKTTATSIGLSQRAALQASGAFGAMFATLKLGDDVSSRMSRQLVKLGADLASFSNQDPEEMLDRLRSGLAGEAEPLRRFGILISAARVEQEAYRSGIAAAGATLTEQQKVLARFNLILRDSGKAQGDFARTSTSQANQERINAALREQAAQRIGQVLLPAYNQATRAVNRWLGSEKNLAQLQRGTARALEIGTGAFRAFRDVVRDVAPIVQRLNSVLGGTESTVKLLLAAFVASKILSFGGALTGLSGQALVATGRVNALRFALLRLGALAVITLGIEVILNREAIEKKTKELLRGHTGGATIKVPANITFSGLERQREALAAAKGEGDLMVKALDQILARFKTLDKQKLANIDKRVAGLRKRLDGVKSKKIEVALVQKNIDKTLGQLAQIKDKSILVRARERGLEAMQLRLAQVKGKTVEVAFVEQGLVAIQARLDNLSGRTIEVAVTTTELGRRADARGSGVSAAGIFANLPGVISDAIARIDKLAKSSKIKATKAFDNLMASLSRDLTAAGATVSEADNLRVLQQQLSAINAQIRIQGRTKDLLDQQADISAQIVTTQRGITESAQSAAEEARATAKAEKEAAEARIRAAREQAIANRKASQFEKLGLTREGAQRVPGAGVLGRRAASLGDQIKGTVLDTAKTQRQLERISKVLAGKFGKVGRDVRAAILQMLNDISSAFKEGSKDTERQTGEITRGGIRSTQRLLRGITGLSPEERKLIQQRNLGVSGRRGLSAFGFAVGGAGATTGFGRPERESGGIFIQNLTVVSNDPNDMIKKLQKKARRSSGGRRGRHGGANLGMQ